MRNALIDRPPLIELKTLTLHPVWAWAIMRGHKRIENRSWATSYRGVLAIHAGMNRTTEAADRRFLESLGIRVPAVLAGAILGTVQVVGCERYSEHYGGELERDPFAFGPWCWRLENPRLFRLAIAMPGKQKLWTCRIPHGRIFNHEGHEGHEEKLQKALSIVKREL